MLVCLAQISMAGCMCVQGYEAALQHLNVKKVQLSMLW